MFASVVPALSSQRVGTAPTPSPAAGPSLGKRVKDFFVCNHPSTSTPEQASTALLGAIGGASAIAFALLRQGAPAPLEWGLAAAAVAGAMAVVSYGAAKAHKHLDHHAKGPLADDFNYHHARPQNITLRSFADHTWETAKYTTPLLLGLAASQLFTTAIPVWAVVGLGALFSMPTWGQQFHKWAHMADEAPGFGKLLQWCRIAISPWAHRDHHGDKFDTNYDVMTGWWNHPVLASAVSSGTSPHHDAEGVTPFPLLSKDDRRATLRERNAVLNQQHDTVTPEGFATLRGHPKSEVS